MESMACEAVADEPRSSHSSTGADGDYDRTRKFEPDAHPYADADVDAIADADAADRGVGPQAVISQTMGRVSLHASVFIAAWIVLSNGTIIFNKYILHDTQFKYPVLLTCWHLTFATAATQLLARTTRLLDGRRRLQMTGPLYLRAVVPIGLAYSGSLVCSNVVYLYLNVSFIQMLKALGPVAVLGFAWGFGLREPSTRVLANVLVIVLGVALTSAGEISFSWIGVLYQVAGTVFEAIRLVMIELLLAEDGQRMDPLVSLYYFAPVCALLNFLVAVYFEIPTLRLAAILDVGLGTLSANALVAFSLNIISVLLIGRTSGLVLSLSGILKNIFLVLLSVVLWSTQITPIQVVGYSVALGGLIDYSIGWPALAAHVIALAGLGGKPGFVVMGGLAVLACALIVGSLW